MEEDLRVDAVYGDVYDHVVKEATGHSDRNLLRQQNRLAHSQEVPKSVRLEARKFLGGIASSHGMNRFSEIIKRELSPDGSEE